MEWAGYRTCRAWYDLDMPTRTFRIRRFQTAHIAVEMGTAPASETVAGARRIVPLERYVAVRLGKLVLAARKPWAISVGEAGQTEIRRIPDPTRRAQLGAALAALSCFVALSGAKRLLSHGQQEEA
jgi:hypothetical protein